MCGSKRSIFIKEQQASGLLCSLGIKTRLSNIPLVGHLVFKRYQQVNTRYKMNEIVNKFLLVGDKFMPEMHLRKPACGPFTKVIILQKFKETGD